MSRRTRFKLLGGVALAAALWAAPASAACPDLPTSKPFAPWGDYADYVPAPGGSFEGPLTWDATGIPSVVSEPNPFALTLDDTSAVQLAPGESISSPPICVTRDHPHLRFTARATDPSAALELDAFFFDDYWRFRRLNLADSNGADFLEWSLHDPVMLNWAHPREGQSRIIYLRFRSRSDSGEWLVDDVFVDPVKRG